MSYTRTAPLTVAAGFYPNGSPKPQIPVELVSLPKPYSNDRIAHVRRLDTGEVIPVPTYGINGLLN